MDDDEGVNEKCPWVLVDQDFYAKRDYVSPLQEREWNLNPPAVRGIKKRLKGMWKMKNGSAGQECCDGRRK